MAFFEDLSKKVSQTGQDAIKKTKIMAETTKLNAQISGERRVIADNYCMLGEKYFELFGENPDGSLALFIAAIKESLTKINEYEDQINKLKGFGSCPGCGAELKEDAVFCTSCGTKLDKPEAEQAPVQAEGRFCSSCGSQLAEGVRFCGSCGAKAE